MRRQEVEGPGGRRRTAGIARKKYDKDNEEGKIENDW
jgi:hypothetical protein